MKQLAVVGLGPWGRNLLRDFLLLRGLGAVVACDRSTLARQRALEAHPGLRVTDDYYAGIVANPDVSCVVIATDVPTHATLALAAIEAGKHVLIEKPLAQSRAEADAIAESARRAGVVVTVDHLLLADPAFEQLERAIAVGALGTLEHVYTRRTNLGRVRSRENVLWSLGPHDIAVMLRLFGARPIRVEAAGGAFLQRSPAIEDVAFVTLFFEGGGLGHMHLSWLDPRKTRQITAVGSRALAVIDDAKEPHQRFQLSPVEISRSAAGIELDTSGSDTGHLDDEPPLLRMCRKFLDCVESGGENPSDVSLGRDVVSVLEAAQAALRTSGADR